MARRPTRDGAASAAERARRDRSASRGRASRDLGVADLPEGAIGDDEVEGQRPSAATDGADLLELLSDPRVGETLGGPRSPSEVGATLAGWERVWRERGLGPWLFRLRASGELVGYAGVRPAPASVEPGAHELLYALRPAFWGRGLAVRLSTLALEHATASGVREVVAYTLVTNRRSQRVLEKLGFAAEREIEHAALPHRLYRRRAPAGGTSC